MPISTTKGPDWAEYRNSKRHGLYEPSANGMYLVQLFNVIGAQKVETVFGYTKDETKADKACQVWVERGTFPTWLKKSD